MPAKSKAQQRLFSMALAVRKGDLPRNKVWKSVLDIVDSDMTNKEIEDFTVMKESMKKSTLKSFLEELSNLHVISLSEYLTEGSLEDRKEFIKQSIEELDQETVNRIYNIINSVSPEAKQQVDAFMGKIGLTFIQDNILNILEKNDDLVNFINYINSGKMMNVKELTANPKGNIFKICAKNTPFHEPTLVRLSKEKSSSTGVQVGEFEFLMRLVLNNASETITCKRGDVTADGVAIEVKSGKARITSAKTKAPETIRHTLNKILQEKYPGKFEEVTNKEFNGNGGMKIPGRFFQSLYKKISEIDKNPNESIIDIIVRSYLSQWPEELDIINNISIIENFVKKYLFSGKNIDEKEFNNIIASICLFCYAMTEKFDNFMVFNKNNGDFVNISTQNIDGLLKQIYDKFSSSKGQLHISAMQNEMNALTGKGIQFGIK